MDTVDEAVELANCSDYSLMSALWTKDVYKAFGVTERIHAGMYRQIGAHNKYSLMLGYTNINGPTVFYEWMRSLAGLG